MKTPALSLVAALLTVTAVGCGGADTADSRSDAATIACTTQTLAAAFTTDCSTLSGADLASCLIGTPPVCQAAGQPGCTCTGEGTNLYAAVASVGLCGRNPELTRHSLQSALCGAAVDIAAGSPEQACGHVQDFEQKVFAKQIKATNKDINTADADVLRAAAQDIEAALGCAPVTPVL